MKYLFNPGTYKGVLCFFLIAFSFRCFSQCNADPDIEDFTKDATYSGVRYFSKSTYVIHEYITITLDAAEIRFAEGTTIQLEQFARLIIRNGSVLSSNCGKTWGGIRVSGDPTMPPAATYQGYVEISGSTIRDAEVGILAYEGGIVNAHNSRFTDNLNSILIEGTGQAYPFPIVNCDFSWMNRTSIAANEKHVQLNNINGISILGCRFKTDFHNLGIGIESNNTTLTVKGSGKIVPDVCPATTDDRRSFFEGLNNAIYLNASNNTCNISMTDFLNNTQGIRSDGNISMQVEGNTFTTDQTAPHDTYQGYYVPRKDIYMYQSMYPNTALIFNNDFLISRRDAFLRSDTYTPAHITLDECSVPVDIQKNNFTSTHDGGWGLVPLIIQNHKGETIDLTTAKAGIFCNTFNGYNNDIVFRSSVGFTIGSSNSPANNIFSNNGSDDHPSVSIFAEESGVILYYREKLLTDPGKEPLNNMNTVVNLSDDGAARNCAKCAPVDTSCPGCKVSDNGSNGTKGNPNLNLVENIDNPGMYTLISDGAAGQMILEISDLSGRVVYSTDISVGQAINLSALSKGLYLYKIQDGSKTIKTGKLIIN
jgi:hypothetical protein